MKLRPTISIITILFILLFVFTLPGCTGSVEPQAPVGSDINPSEDSFTDTGTVGDQPGEPTDDSLSKYKKLTHYFHELDDFLYIVSDGEELLKDGTLFIFEKSIAEDVRESFVESQLELNKLLDIPDGFTYVLTESYQDRYDEACQASFVLTTSVQTWKQAS